MLFICYPRCSTCKKAKLWLTERGIKFEERDIKLENFEKKNLAS
jgi:arsenate reductase